VWTVGAGLAPPARVPQDTPKGTPMPTDETLPIAKQIADGLEYANERASSITSRSQRR